ncbi:hypothetical protein [Tenacibaculum piscium]|uniref:hypothetical protein n=1 Tax=Tenacibaculum piscium TaxID=1458515 RepID=UPI001F484580|nr:hypothetical protein [Tenacibaculum piscium]MCG8184080.1 hypothetical protein [Tenacibaculum piscium]MCG8205473.1 hypothetical protein [Tenacibaculum piscium]
MKNLIVSLLLIGIVETVSSQSDIIKITEVKKAQKTTKKGVDYTTKVKVTTEKSQRTKFDPNQKHKLNQNRVESPVAIKKTIMVDNDLDPNYDAKTSVKYYKYKGIRYSFFIDENNLLITYKVNDKDITSTKAIKSINNNFYVVEGNDFNGVGYYDKDNNFVIEYKNKKSNKLEYAIFETFKL